MKSRAIRHRVPLIAWPRRLRVVLLVTVGVLALACLPAVADDDDPTAAPTESTRAMPTSDRPAPGQPVTPEPDWPFYPDGDGFPYGLSDDPHLPRSAADVKTGDPKCPAPDLPAAHNTGAGGYQVPIRIKLSNGFVQAGFTPGAHKYGLYPFGEQMSLTGWAVGTVSLPSMQMHLDPSGVVMCDDGAGGLATIFNDWRRYAPGGPDAGDSDLWAKRAWTWQDGTKFQGIPGTPFAQSFYPAKPGVYPGSPLQLQVKEFLASAASATVAGVNPDGSLRVDTNLKTGFHILFFLTAANVTAADCVFDADVTLSTDAKSVVQPQKLLYDAGSYGTFRLGAPPPIPASELAPTKSLSGAVEGGTAILGSNDFHISNLDVPQTQLCYSSLPIALFGYDENGINQVYNEVDPNGYSRLRLPASPGFGVAKKWPPISPGIADMSVEMTVDEVGLPKYDDLPTSYGFE